MRCAVLLALLVPASCDAQAKEPPAVAAQAVAPSPPLAKAATPTPKVPKPSATARLEYEQNSIDVFRAVSPATVFVTQKQVVRDRWSMRALEVPSGSGTGFIWDAEGHVVTNYHVIAQSRSVEVALVDGTIFAAELVGGDPNKDIAVLKITAPANKLTPVRLPPENMELEVGQKALAIGNPFGLDHTLTVGAISALGRDVKGFGGVTIRGMIQTDASINPGNSGGPLLDARGQLIGMNTMIFSNSGSSAGIGFAVPVKIIRKLVPQIIRHGKPMRAGLGVELVSDELARANGIAGVVILEAVPGGPAASAGLEGLKRTRRGVLIGDVIVGMEEFPIESYDDLYQVLDRYEPGDEVEIVVLRDGKRSKRKLTLTELR